MPDWTLPDPEAGRASWSSWWSAARRYARRKVTLYLPARFQVAARYPLLVVHDGGDFLEYGSVKTVLDNLIHRLDVADRGGLHIPGTG